MAMAEFEPYSFEPMQNSSSSEDEASEGEEPRRGNTTWCSCELCINWEGQQVRESFCCQENNEAVNRISCYFFIQEITKNPRLCYLLLFCVTVTLT